MKIVIQRAEKAKVSVDGEIVGQIGKGFMVLVGVGPEDTKQNAVFLVNKMCNLRIFEDEQGKMNLSIKDVGGQILAISQFTLYADCKKGNRPSFTGAAKPEQANELYEYFMEEIKKQGIKVEHGIFGAHMKVDFINDGPVTILLEN